MALPKPYPPTLIAYTDWDTVIDATEIMRERLTFYPGNTELPLSAFYYRVGTNGLVYREGTGTDEYLVINAHENVAAYYSALSICRRFAQSCQIEWVANISAPGASKDFFPGGLEFRHGRANQGMCTFNNNLGAYRAWSSWGGANTVTVLAGQDWTSDTTFRIIYDETAGNDRARYYVDGALVATHTAPGDNVPGVPMSFFLECGHIAPAPATESLVNYKWRSFTYTAL